MLAFGFVLCVIAALVALIFLRKRRGCTMALAMFILAAVALLFGPCALIDKEMPKDEPCMSHLRSLTLAMETYLQDLDGRYPPGDRWVAALRPILARQGEDDSVFSCPDAPSGHGGYALNAHVAGKCSRGWPDPGHTVVFFETDSPVAAVGGPALLPAHSRHPQGDAYGFADFHHLVRVARSEAFGWFRWDPNKPPPEGTP